MARPAFAIDEAELSAHSLMFLRVYGYEPVWLLSVRGDDAETCDCTLAFKNLRLSGSPQVLVAALEAARTVLVETINHPELWDLLLTRRTPDDLDGPDQVSPFWALPAYEADNGPETAE